MFGIINVLKNNFCFCKLLATIKNIKLRKSKVNYYLKSAISSYFKVLFQVNFTRKVKLNKSL